MERFMRGEVLVVNFPYSDMSKEVLRPALVITTLKGEDVMLAPITSKDRGEENTVILKNEDFKVGSLKRISYIRLGKIITLHVSRVKYKVGVLNSKKIEEIYQTLYQMFKI